MPPVYIGDEGKRNKPVRELSCPVTQNYTQAVSSAVGKAKIQAFDLIPQQGMAELVPYDPEIRCDPYRATRLCQVETKSIRPGMSRVPVTQCLNFPF